MRKLHYFLFLIVTLSFSCESKDIEKPSSENSAELFLPWIVSTSSFEMNAAFSETGDEFYYSIADAYQNYNVYQLNNYINYNYIVFSYYIFFLDFNF